MIQNLRQIKSRIKSVESTRKITRAMEMVSAAKLNRVRNAFYASRHYSSNLEFVLKRLLSDIDNASSPYLEKRDGSKGIAMCVIASDAGLCGTYNNNIIRAAENFINIGNRKNVKIIAIGKEVSAYFKNKGYEVARSHLGLYGRHSAKVVDDLVSELTNIFLSGTVDEVHIAYTHFSSNLRHIPAVEKFLNISYVPEPRNYYILEPGTKAILDRMVPRYLSAKMNTIVLDAFTAEHSARMLAMKVATDNAEELINTLTLQRNKARQAAITKEVLEIALSAEALKE
ncbi:MAG: ATP synthase F1 subunit gamma [Candidatus Omnitrophota bacterium]|jgi:F-type H+-transporting ATPase subunit gamma